METINLLERITKIISQEGPTVEEFGEFTIVVNELVRQISENKLSHAQLQNLKNNCEFLKDERSIMGHILTKPYGYAGDFHIIDRIYTQDTSAKFSKWDRYSLSNSAAQAVRNRKDYFKEKVMHSLKEGESLLNIASGPARDLYELYNENPILDIKTTCVEMDEKAISYARVLNKHYLDKITFIQKSIFRFNTENKFNIIWSAGLFDYFDNKAFIMLLKKFKEWLKNDGEIIIGNFNENHNPSRAYMEFFGDWYLNHRTEEQIYHLARQAGYDQLNITVGREPENVNLFLHLRK
ncbi:MULTISPECIES: class I SAM-dependent methyltransferase [unclassified Mucilaginibacter]|uniref:class I SAM-dependent methyltransferase n=1 Tax=unclassified Mucilaginibacter TaxID=2617802 RepID=UPI002AC8C54D|nr:MULTISPECIES: class I SAM-dependent methyltransferase [unclassified Mucilaginibacter]MEB0262566.1 class I SAM-dependent methyltransferase [Mucilaginibacter sp. 10I4]MEB0278403.1 class I SAM-dependent methyltransferase [Mucilaginibacter sp. 10B2]MEB0302238.1 class I SAM-dependent methyltransferase [Mucilaginibacter sp. 5C4]WPX24048.1 class I SAM-dependent methyltransferase [Mucilaginibacter sp. 5C4]